MVDHYIELPLEASGGVTSLNSETGAVVLVAGSGITVTPSGQNITIAATGGGGGLTSINSDTTAAQLMTVGTSGTNFAIVDAGSGSHVFNLPIASATNTGKLSNTDWSTFNSKGSGTVTSVSLTPPVGYSVSGSPVTTSGTLAISLKTTQAISASAIDWSAGNVFTKSIGSTNTTFTFSNQADSQTVVAVITATTGVVTWPVGIKWPGGAAPTQTVSGTDVYTFIDVSGTIYGNAVQGLS